MLMKPNSQLGAALGAGLPTPPKPPTEGLPTDPPRRTHQLETAPLPFQASCFRAVQGGEQPVSADPVSVGRQLAATKEPTSLLAPHRPSVGGGSDGEVVSDSLIPPTDTGSAVSGTRRRCVVSSRQSPAHRRGVGGGGIDLLRTELEC